MNRRVTVRVPSSRIENGTSVVGAQWLTASFALDASRARLVERGGTLAHDDTPADDDPVLRAARRAMTEAGREPPPALRVRVVSQIAAASGDGARLAAAAAGALGARALFDLPLDDDAMARIAAQLDGADVERAALVVASHTVINQQACD